MLGSVHKRKLEEYCVPECNFNKGNEISYIESVTRNSVKCKVIW